MSPPHRFSSPWIFTEVCALLSIYWCCQFFNVFWSFTYIFEGNLCGTHFYYVYWFPICMCAFFSIFSTFRVLRLCACCKCVRVVNVCMLLMCACWNFSHVYTFLMGSLTRIFGSSHYLTEHFPSIWCSYALHCLISGRFLVRVRDLNPSYSRTL